MKSLLFTILLLGSFSLSAQNISFERVDRTEQTSSFSLEVGNKSFQAYKGKTGAIYIVRTSAKTGKEYKQYLGYSTSHTLDGLAVYSNKDVSQYHVLVLGRTGWPKKELLKVAR